MTSVLLSCLCKKDFEWSPPRAGELMTCRIHGPAAVIEFPSRLECLDCDYRKEYDALAKIRICVTATKHMFKTGHRVRHYHPFDTDGTMCLHVPQKVPVFAVEDPPR